MKTVKVKFVGKWEGIKPEENLVYYWLTKNGYDVQFTNDPDYVICDVFGASKYEYCKFPQVRIFETGENYTPDFNVVDYAISRYPIQYQDRNFYLPGCFCPAEHWLALPQKDRGYTKEFLEKKKYFCNFISSHDSENGLRGEFFRKLCTYKRVEAPGTFLNNMPDGQVVSWTNESKTEFQRQCKFTLCFESTSHYGFITEKITDAFYADTIPIYYGSSNITDIFNKNAFINCMDYASLDEVLEKVKALDQDDEKYLEMLRQPILVDPEYPRQLERDLEKYVCTIFDQPIEKAYRRCRVYYPKNHNDFLAKAVEPSFFYKFKQELKRRFLKDDKQ